MIPELVVAAAVVMLGAAIQSSSGMGLAVVSLPVLALVMPERMPQVLLLLGMPMLTWMVWSEREHVRLHGLTPVIAGRFVGTAPGALVVTVLTAAQLNLFFAIASLAAVAGVLAALRTARLHRTDGLPAFTGGVASGLMGTAAGVGGPPLAWLYAGRDGPDIRANLSIVFLVGNVVSLASLALAGRLGATDWRMAALLLVPLALGVGLGARVRLHVTRQRAAWLLASVVLAGAASLAYNAATASVIL